MLTSTTEEKSPVNVCRDEETNEVNVMFGRKLCVLSAAQQH